MNEQPSLIPAGFPIEVLEPAPNLTPTEVLCTIPLFGRLDAENCWRTLPKSTAQSG